MVFKSLSILSEGSFLHCGFWGLISYATAWTHDNWRQLFILACCIWFIVLAHTGCDLKALLNIQVNCSDKSSHCPDLAAFPNKYAIRSSCCVCHQLKRLLVKSNNFPNFFLLNVYLSMDKVTCFAKQFNWLNKHKRIIYLALSGLRNRYKQWTYT